MDANPHRPGKPKERWVNVVKWIWVVFPFAGLLFVYFMASAREALLFPALGIVFLVYLLLQYVLKIPIR